MSKQPDFFQHLQAIAAKAEEAFNEGSKQIKESTGELYTAVEAQIRESVGFVQEHAASFSAEAKQHLSLNEIGQKLAALGGPAIAFAVAASIAGSAGLAGGALITAALAMLGGPAGMIGGLLTLGVLTLIADAVSKYGIEAILYATFNAQRDQGVAMEQIHADIDQLWISNELKYKLKTQLATPRTEPQAD